MSQRPTALLREGLAPERHPFRAFTERFFRARGAKLATAFLLFVFGCALFAPLVAGDPFTGGPDALLPPLTGGYLLGTDHLGRDLWSQLVYGARISLTVGVLAALSALVIGVVVGAVSGYVGGWVDAILMRVAEFFQTLPRFVVALIVVAIFGADLWKTILILALLSWPQTARVVRTSYVSLKDAAFVDAARVGGMGSVAIVVKEILPNVAAPIIVITSLDVATAILLEAGLGFFGLGDPNNPSWGSMLNEAQQYLRVAWWMSVFPGLAIALTVQSFNVLGDALNDAMNPRLRDRS